MQDTTLMASHVLQEEAASSNAIVQESTATPTTAAGGLDVPMTGSSGSPGTREATVPSLSGAPTGPLWELSIWVYHLHRPLPDRLMSQATLQLHPLALIHYQLTCLLCSLMVASGASQHASDHGQCMPTEYVHKHAHCGKASLMLQVWPVLCPLCLLTPSQAHLERVTASCCSAHPASAQVLAAARAVARHHREGLQPVPMLPSSSSRCVTGLEVAGLVAGPCRAVIAVQQGRLQETQLCVIIAAAGLLPLIPQPLCGWTCLAAAPSLPVCCRPHECSVATTMLCRP